MFEVGQVWECINKRDYLFGHKFTIIEIEKDGKVIATNSKEGKVVFAYDSTSPIDKNDWFLVSGDMYRCFPNVEKCSPVSFSEKNDFQFFSSVASGNCACNIPRHQCRYHS